MSPLKNLLSDKREFHVVERWKWYFIASGGILLLAIILIFVIGLNIGVDFTGGYSLEVKYSSHALSADN